MPRRLGSAISGEALISMTPLAQRIVNHDLTLPSNKQEMRELQSSDCHCFDISEIIDLIDDLINNYDWRLRDDARIFLPSPLTWIEWKTNYGRKAALLRNKTGQEYIYIDLVYDDKKGISVSDYPIAAGKDDSGLFTGYDTTEDPKLRMSRDELFINVRIFMAALSLINTPKIIGRKQHQPHAGLQKKIAKSHGMVGRFPLMAWTEIILQVTAPQILTGQTRDSHLTGGKALHFCRAHLRMRLGKVEFVSAHWRGDPAIGIKRSRYSIIK